VSDLRRAVDAVPLWYHTIELGEGIATPGYFDLRPVVERLPWPDVRGKRCLDVGTYDGYLAFELERRGASEVVALDIPNHEDWDWPPDVRARGGAALAELAGPQKGAGFRTAREALGSTVEKVDMSVYELSPERAGTFDVVVCGSLLLHLRDPLRALECVRSVCAGLFMSSEEVDLSLSLAHPRRAIARLNGSGAQLQWSVPNVAGHRRMVFAAGFEILTRTAPYSEPFGAGHPARQGGLRRLPLQGFRTFFTGAMGVPHAAVLARPRVTA
jgi:tRNA (mo5U34)-methyltransferase